MNISFTAAGNEMFIEQGQGTAGGTTIVGEKIPASSELPDRHSFWLISRRMPSYAFKDLIVTGSIHICQIDHNLVALFIVRQGNRIVKLL
jgi:hypothetical protein